MKFDCTFRKTCTTVRVARVLAGLALASGAIGFAGGSSVSVRRDLDTIVKLAPAPVMVAKGREFRAADAAAKNIEGAQAFLGAGESMEPLYATGTAIVVMPCKFSQLHAGMSVVYVSHSGRGVAHVLVNEMPGGWIAQGLNNKSEDSDLVTADNLVGVIVQAYASADTQLRRDVASRSLLKSGATQVALSLPKAGSAGMALAYENGTR